VMQSDRHGGFVEARSKRANGKPRGFVKALRRMSRDTKKSKLS